MPEDLKKLGLNRLFLIWGLIFVNKFLYQINVNSQIIAINTIG